MGVSETIVAAMIGAIATVTTALFQLFAAFRARAKADTSKPRAKGLTMRSVAAVLALMVASAAGGFLYSELLKQRHSEDIRAMRQELRELKELTAARASEPEPPASAQADFAPPEPKVQPAVLASGASSSESVVYVPACRAQIPGTPCGEQDAQRIALCGTIPSYTHVRSIDLFVQPDAIQNPWDEHRVLFEQDLGGAKFTGNSFEYAQGNDLKAVCVNFVHWSSEHPHIARLLVQYGAGTPAPAPILDESFQELESGALQTPVVMR